MAKGWSNKRGKAERGRADTLLAGHDGRPVCFVAGEPSGLAATLPKALADAERGLAALLAGPAITPAAKNTRLIPAAQQKITAARTRLGLQMVLRLLAHNAGHWLSNQLNAYLRDDDVPVH